MSPIGNPQNLLIATESAIPSPFITFAIHLILPTVFCLLAGFFILRVFYRTDWTVRPIVHVAPAACDSWSMQVSQLSLGIIITLILLNSLSAVIFGAAFISLPLIALCGAVPVILLSHDRIGIVRSIDWATLVFFASMFVLMASVWQSGFIQSFVDTGTLGSGPIILATSIVVSQFISNVPFVALFQPLIVDAGGTTKELLALVAGSTIAGNLTILGAGSNVIIIQGAEREGATITFLEFARIGIPLTIIQAGIYWAFLSFL